MARGDQLSRQWKIVQLMLASRRGKSVAQISDALGCHPRSVYRDIEALQAAGFPLYTEVEAGKKYWQLTDSARQNLPLPLNLSELMALYFSRGMLKALGDDLFAEPLDSLFEKVKTTLPRRYHRYLNQFSDIILFAPIPHSCSGKRSQALLAVIQEAIAAQRAVAIDYYAPSRQRLTQRKVAPYRIWFSGRAHYLIGHCYLRDDIRIFAIGRIRRITLSDIAFTLPNASQLDQVMADSFGVFRGDPVMVRIEFTARVADYIRETRWHESQRLTDGADGTVVLEMTVAGVAEIKYWILKWGKDARVLQPPELKAALRREAQAILDHT